MLGKQNELEAKLEILIEAFAERLPVDNVINAKELLEHREPGEAFELLCTQVHEYGLSVAPAIYATIVECPPTDGQHSWLGN